METLLLSQKTKEKMETLHLPMPYLNANRLHRKVYVNERLQNFTRVYSRSVILLMLTVPGESSFHDDRSE